MRVLVMGGTGFIGSWVVRHLVAMGHEVMVFSRGRKEADLPDGVARAVGDQRYLADHAEVLRQFGPDSVVAMHLGTEAEARGFVRVFAGLARRVTVISSMDVYRAYNRLRRVEPGPPDPTPLTEDSPVRERLYPYRDVVDEPWAREYDKLLVERAIMGAPGLPGTVLRLPFVYGPGDGLHRLKEYLDQMDAGSSEIALDPVKAEWLAPRGYVENIGLAIALAGTDPRAAGRVYNVADAEALSEREWATAIGAAAGWRGRVVVDGDKEKPPSEKAADDHDYHQHLQASSARIRAELGYSEVVPQDEALRRTVAWERSQAQASRGSM